MQIPDINLNSPQFQRDPDATREMAFYNARIVDILRDVYQNLKSVKIVTTEPSATEMQELLDSSDIVILHHATAGNRKVVYRYQGTVYTITSA